MPTKEHRIQIRIDDDLKAMLDRLAEYWRWEDEPLTPSEVVRACVRRAHAEMMVKTTALRDAQSRGGKP